MGDFFKGLSLIIFIILLSLWLGGSEPTKGYDELPNGATYCDGMTGCW